MAAALPLVSPPAKGVLHVWTLERPTQENLARLRSQLSADEQARADRFKVRSRRESFISWRAGLRAALAAYAGVEPQEVPLEATAEGKPFWRLPLSFNLTHRGPLALLAVSAGRTVGIDLEVIDARTNYDAVACQALSPCELTKYEGLPRADRPAALLRAWTRKEAFLKALGVAMGRPLSAVEVTFLMDEPPQVLATGDDAEPAEAWRLESWSPAAGQFAAVAVPQENAAHRIEHFSATSLTERHASPAALPFQAAWRPGS